MAETNSNNNVPQLQIRFVTKQQQYSVPNYPISLPSTIDSKKLNNLVNKLRKDNGAEEIGKDVEFDFIVCSEFLRSTLIEHTSERGVSTEEVIEIEYLEKHPPPEPQDCLIHDDWVSSVAVCDKWILTGCYDNTVHIWTSKGKHKLTIPGHTAAVKSVAWITLDNDTATFVSASQDQTAIIWQWSIATNSVECINICRGHEQSLESVAVNANSTEIATGAWDTMLKIWSTSTTDDSIDGPSSSKKAKTDKGKTRIPIRTLKAHKEAISGVVWSDNTEIITSSWDHTLKIWDSELGGMKHEISGNKSFFDVDYSQLSKTVITACADRHVRLYDPRSTEGSMVKTTFTSHSQWVQSVCWSKTHENLFISGACDNAVKLWDTRSPKAPLYELSGHEDKVLSCNWSNPMLMVSGGADNTVRIFKSSRALQ